MYTHLYGGIKKFKADGVKDMLSQKLILDVDRIIYEKDVMAEKREEKAKIEIAKNMLDDGMTIEQAAKLTKLPLNKIKSRVSRGASHKKMSLLPLFNQS